MNLNKNKKFFFLLFTFDKVFKSINNTIKPYLITFNKHFSVLVNIILELFHNFVLQVRFLKIKNCFFLNNAFKSILSATYVFIHLKITHAWKG